ncbi:hypothetical protein HN011_010330 [Eciton burchellii]|nr:hypothetical protein HN011_010330 [Eciton burchellii]
MVPFASGHRPRRNRWDVGAVLEVSRPFLAMIARLRIPHLLTVRHYVLPARRSSGDNSSTWERQREALVLVGEDSRKSVDNQGIGSRMCRHERRRPGRRRRRGEKKEKGKKERRIKGGEIARQEGGRAGTTTRGTIMAGP